MCWVELCAMEGDHSALPQDRGHFDPEPIGAKAYLS
jgi:hypothetical protein